MHTIDDFTGLEVRVSDPDAVQAKVIDSNLRITISCAVNKVRSIRVPLNYDVRDQKVRLTFSRVEYLPFGAA